VVSGAGIGGFSIRLITQVRTIVLHKKQTPFIFNLTVVHNKRTGLCQSKGDRQMKVTKQLARDLADELSPLPRMRAELRDMLDIKTGGELETFQLDLLEDWVVDEGYFAS